MGVSECSGGPCHGSAAQLGDRIWQNEHTLWIRYDPHSSAYSTLQSEPSAAIARNLGLEEPAEQAPICLDCHADHAALRAPKHRLEEGVGCEACHGGAENWLQSHTAPEREHSQNLTQGMYPADETVARARLCLSCHFGNDQKFLSHRLLGAGHPRLRFELDTYLATQPPHYQIDDDYRERGKSSSESVKNWGIGQAVLVQATLDVIADPSRNHEGIWPEFAVLDCYSCHHPIQDRRLEPKRSAGLRSDPGTPRLNDATFLMLRNLLKVTNPESAEQLRKGTRSLHGAMSRGIGDRAEIARGLSATVENIIPEIERWQADVASVRAILNHIIDEGLSGEYRDYLSAEQAAQAIQSLAATLHEMDPFGVDDLGQIQASIDAITSMRPTDFRYQKFKAELEKLRSLIS